jgi:hypothetical protein
MPIGLDYHWRTGHRHPADASYISGCVRIWLPDANRVGLAWNVRRVTTCVIEVPDVDVVIACIQVVAGSKAQDSIVVPRRIVLKSHSAKSRVAAAGRVAGKRRVTKACVKAPRGIAQKRADTASCIEITFRIADERIRTVRRIADTSCVAKEGGSSIGRVSGACRVE